MTSKQGGVPQGQAIAEALDRSGKTYRKHGATGQVIAVPNPLGRALHVVAPWGEVQSGSADCMIADKFDPATKKRAGQPYVIDRAEFAKSYSPIKSAWYSR